jgi:hypothetical protein
VPLFVSIVIVCILFFDDVVNAVDVAVFVIVVVAVKVVLSEGMPDTRDDGKIKCMAAKTTAITIIVMYVFLFMVYKLYITFAVSTTLLIASGMVIFSLTPAASLCPPPPHTAGRK